VQNLALVHDLSLLSVALIMETSNVSEFYNKPVKHQRLAYWYWVCPAQIWIWYGLAHPTLTKNASWALTNRQGRAHTKATYQ